MKRILIIEDNADLGFGLRSNLEHEGYDVDNAATGVAGLDLALAGEYDLLILDVMMPEMDGFEVLQKFREVNETTPVLMLTARGEETDKVRGLRSGADDYVTKPFGLMEVLARVEALLRRSNAEGESGGVLRLRNIVINTEARTVMVGGNCPTLAPKEFDLLVELARNVGRVVSRQELMRAVWGHSAAVVSRTVDTHIAELRRKLADSDNEASLIATVPKIGYRLQP